MKRTLEEWRCTTIAGRHAFEILADWIEEREQLLQEIADLTEEVTENRNIEARLRRELPQRSYGGSR